MAVQALSSVVLQKLNDLVPIHDSLALRDVIDDLRKLDGIINADFTLSDDKDATNYLRLLFSAEDNIYVFSDAAHGRHKMGFGFSLLYASCGPSKTLRRQLHPLAAEIKDLLELKSINQVVVANLQSASTNLDEEGYCNYSAAAHGRSMAGELELGTRVNLPLVERKRLSRSSSLSRSTNPDQDGPPLIGFAEDQEHLIRRLTQGVGGVIPVVGPAGAGKATLVQKIYNLRKIKEHFNCLAWVHALDESITVPRLLANLLQQVHKSKEGLIPKPDELIAKVSESLEDKTYLVVLDHVGDVQSWDDMKSAFPNLGNGKSKSKVILIIRDRNVASSISKKENCPPLCLSYLCDEHSWDLLLTKVSSVHQRSHPIDNKSKQLDEMLKKCKGCPLDIELFGGLLSTKGTGFDDWEPYLNILRGGVEIWQLCYNDLPAHSKLCLLYMALFPNALEIPVRRLHRLWLAEGFIRPSPNMSVEETVEECFNDLVKRNFIKITKHRSDGSPRRCRLPRAIRQYLSKINHQIKPFYIRQGHLNDSQLLSDYKDARSYMSFNSQRNDTPAKEVGNFISKIIRNKGFGVLRVIDLEGVYKPTLPQTLNQLFHLRYLGLRWTFIDHLPKSVGDLPYLDTLDLKRTYINSLPSSVWKLEHLRHLNLPGIRLNCKNKKRHNSLTGLRTLEGLIVDNETDVKEELSHFLELRELGITCQLSSFSNLISWIQKLTNLKFLWLKSKDEMGQPSEINLEPLAALSCLSRMSLLGHLKQLPASNAFPPNLKVLTLSVSRLQDDPMPVLSKLSSLSVLRLLADSYLGTAMNCPKNGFQNLQVLKLWMLKELVEWTVEKAGMPLLKQLNIRYCRKLKQLPRRLLDQDTLEELTLTSMPKDFIGKDKQNKSRQPRLIENDYEFTSLPWENDPDLWKEL